MLALKRLGFPSDHKAMEFEARAKKAIKAIPRGKVATYAQIAALAGNDRAARQVVRVLHASSEKDRLPWHRVINSRGGISLARGRGFEEQKSLLLDEGVRVSRVGRVDLYEFRWEPAAPRSRAARQFLRAISRTKPQLPFGRIKKRRIRNPRAVDA
jgi:methylated-DNA-protein-cysteine methyltransferase-like protein